MDGAQSLNYIHSENKKKLFLFGRNFTSYVDTVLNKSVSFTQRWLAVWRLSFIESQTENYFVNSCIN